MGTESMRVLEEQCNIMMCCEKLGSCLSHAAPPASFCSSQAVAGRMRFGGNTSQYTTADLRAVGDLHPRAQGDGPWWCSDKYAQRATTYAKRAGLYKTAGEDGPCGMSVNTPSQGDMLARSVGKRDVCPALASLFDLLVGATPMQATKGNPPDDSVVQVERCLRKILAAEVELTMSCAASRTCRGQLPAIPHARAPITSPL